MNKQSYYAAYTSVLSCIFKRAPHAEKKLVCNFLDNSGIAFVLARHIFTDNKMKSYIHALLLHGEKKYKRNWK